MTLRPLYALVLWIVLCAIGLAQSHPYETAEPLPGVPYVPDPSSELVAPDSWPSVAGQQSCDRKSRLWARAEFLLWWIDDAPMPVPLVTGGNPADPVPGALGQPGTRVRFGGSDLELDEFAGTRVSVGWWFNDCQTLGMELSGFMLEQQTTGFQAGSNAAGNPPIYVPLFRSDLGVEGSFTISDPVLAVNGNIQIAARTQLWGAEGNGLYCLHTGRNSNLQLLLGFRYLNLDEDLVLSGALGDPGRAVNNTFRESFSTDNDFYGGQVGARFHWQCCRLSVDLEAKVAVGSVRQQVNTAGFITQSGAGAAITGTLPGAIFTQPTNIGTQSRNTFAALPQGQIKVGWQVTQRMRLAAAYDFMYLSEAVRPGNQIDRNVNRTQQLGGVLAGPARPSRLFVSDDFFAHGVSFIAEFRF